MPIVLSVELMKQQIIGIIPEASTRKARVRNSVGVDFILARS